MRALKTITERNGSIPKTIKTSMGKIQINTPRDRNSQFHPHIIPKKKAMRA